MASKVSPESDAAGMSMVGKRVIVTGGSKGIGLASARLFNELGAHVTIVARGKETLECAKQQMPCPDRCELISADLSSQSGISDMVKAYPHQELHALINNAGTNIRKRAEDFTSEEFESIFSSNFFSAYRISVGFLPHLKRAGSASVVNVGSVAGTTHIPSGCAYGASKAAMEQMTRNLAVEWSRFGIRVNVVAPGPIETPLMDGAHTIYKTDFQKRLPMHRMGKPDEVARPIVFFASAASSYVTGQLLHIDGGFTATSFNEIPSYWEEEAAPAKRTKLDCKP